MPDLKGRAGNLHYVTPFHNVTQIYTKNPDLKEVGINYYLKRSLKKTKSLRNNSQSVQIKATKTRMPKTTIKLLNGSIHQRIKISTKIIVILQR